MYELSPFSFLQETFSRMMCPPAADSVAWRTLGFIKLTCCGPDSGPPTPWAPTSARLPVSLKSDLDSTDLAARKYLSLSSPAGPRASLNQLSLPLGDYWGFINEQGVLFHTSYQTAHKTSSLGFHCLVTHAAAVPSGNGSGLWWMLFLCTIDLALSEPEYISHQNMIGIELNPGRDDAVIRLIYKYTVHSNRWFITSNIVRLSDDQTP